MQLSNETLKDWTAYVLEQHPNEACAFIVDGKLLPVENLSETPEDSFKVSGVDRVRAHALGNVEAFLHSHPYILDVPKKDWFPEWASESDMKTWIADNLPWGIVASDGEGLSPIVWYDDRIEAVAPLEQRQFISGIQDCYSVIRDYYRLNLGILIPNFARGYGWWETDANLYERNFESAGFVEIPINEATVNDAFLMRLEGDVLVHAAVIVGDNTILHHCIRRLSGYDTISKWSRQIVKAVRYEGIHA